MYTYKKCLGEIDAEVTSTLKIAALILGAK